MQFTQNGVGQMASLALEQMQGWHRELKAEGTNVEEIIWWKMDDDHHQTVIVYPSKEAAQADIKKTSGKPR